MSYPQATDADVASVREHGWIAVADAIDVPDIDDLSRRCVEIPANKERMAADWLWDEGTSFDERDFKIVQSFPTVFWPCRITDAGWTFDSGAPHAEAPAFDIQACVDGSLDDAAVWTFDVARFVAPERSDDRGFALVPTDAASTFQGVFSRTPPATEEQP